ncbi:MAG: InlB B-repeat-containing protein [Bacteroidaceae bacterium]|nr:InlB B-repeat-containing protein [Bacteroidaceae bacterium]
MKKFFLTLVVVLCAATARAAERTVTYTFHQESPSGNIMTYAFTRSGTSFGYKTGAKTATVYDYQHTTGFTVELDDDIHLQLKMNESQLTTAVYDNLTGIILKGDYNPSLIVTSGHYYITHIKMANFDSQAISASAPPFTGGVVPIDLDVDMDLQNAAGNRRAFAASFTGTHYFVQLTITYADAPRPYAISFNEVEGLTNPNPATYNMTTNTFNIVAPTRTGYDLGAVTYTDALHPNPTAAVLPMNIARGDAATRKAISFNAAWTAHHYSVHYEANGGSGEMDDQDFTYGDAGQALSANSFTREGYTFVGWNTAADGSGTGYTDGQQTPNVTATDGATVTLYAQWAINTYKVHYDKNSEDATGTMDDQDFTYGDAGQALSANSFTREGYTFIGWNTAADGSGTGYADGQQTPNVTATDGATVTLYAQWAAGVRVTYIDADGTEQNVVAIPIVGSQTDYGTPGTGELWWYVLDGEVSLDHLHFNDDFTHLILADGARLTANSSTEIAVRAKGFTIYAQSNGTGQIIASSEKLDGIGVDANYKFTINGGNISAATSRENRDGISTGDITINGGSVEAIGGKNGYGIRASNFTIKGGNVTATGIGEYGLGISGRLTINGGNLTATATGENGHGIYATGTGITLAGGNVTATGGDSGHGIFGATTLAGGTVRASSYSGAVGTHSYNDYYTDGTSIYYLTLNDEQKKNIAGKTMQPALRLRDNGNNNTAISGHDGETSAVFIADRTLYKDGDWNTLTLPFDLGDEEAQGGHEFDGTPLEGATVKALANSESSGTGYDASTGTLALYFVDANKIEAGVPYLVKWDKAADYDDHPTDYDIVSPVFTGVTVSNEDPADRKVISYDHNVEFRGNYSPVALPGNDASNLYLGTQNKLYWPSDDKTIKSFRAYFHVALSGNHPARNIELNLGEDSPTAVEEIQDSRFRIQCSLVNGQCSMDNEPWYDLSGRKYTGKPTKPGIYVHKGEKVSL